MTATHRSVPGTIVAALLLSAAAHAAVVLGGRPAEPLPAVVARVDPLRAVVVLQAGRRSSAAPVLRTEDAAPAARTADTLPVRPSLVAFHGPQRLSEKASLGTAPSTSEPDADASGAERPTPITYPVVEVPADDDPHRVGLVRLMLVVSSDGTVASTVVTAATLSPDYVERIVHSFEQMRFRPARSRGLPRASWYEVVVNFDFDPSAQTAL